MARTFKMSEIVQSMRPRIIEAVTIKYKHLQPFMKTHLHKCSWESIESVLNVIRETEKETNKVMDAEHKDSQPQATESGQV